LIPDVRDEIKSEQSRTGCERDGEPVGLKSGEIGEEVCRENTSFVFIRDEVYAPRSTAYFSSSRYSAITNQIINRNKLFAYLVLPVRCLSVGWPHMYARVF
jgi:hypothetical protein